MSKRTAKASRPAPCFREHQWGIPIAGLPEPLPCPFCNHTDVNIEIEDSPSRICHAECGYCGALAAYASEDEERGISRTMDVIREVARLWNTRPGVRP